MLRYYLKIALRSLFWNKTYSLINIFGLSFGIACSILILLWVTDEISFDRYHENSQNIYRVAGDDAVVGKMATTCGPLAGYMKDNYPEIIRTTRYLPYDGSVFKYSDKLIKIENGAFADPDFFKMFSFNFIHGDPDKALTELSNIVLTESTAKIFFGNENAVGKTLLIDGKDPVLVSAVIGDLPSNSQLQFDFMINTEILKYIGFPIDSWDNAGFNTFIQVEANTNIDNLNNNISGIMSKQIPGFSRTLFLQPLTDIHLNTELAYDLAVLGDPKYIVIFSAIALFLIMIAGINYINLSTAVSIKRLKEIGIRKILGSTRIGVMKQFIVESLLIIVVSFVIALVLVELMLPMFNRLAGKEVSLNYLDNIFLTVSLIIAAIVTLSAGIYPALFMSGFKAVNSLKNVLNSGSQGLQLRKFLVVVQFSLSIILLIGTTTVYSQISFIRNKKLGFDKENILYFEAKGKFLQEYNSMKNELLKETSIIDVSAEDRLLTNFTQSTANIVWQGKEPGSDIQIEYSSVDYNYFDFLNVELESGRFFSKDMSTDKHTFILNQEAVNRMGITEPLGTNFILNGKPGTIIGIIKNTNFKSLHHKVIPTAYLQLVDYESLSFTYNGKVLVKTESDKTELAIAAAEKLWREVNPNLPFEYHFLDETIDKQYVKENQTAELFGYFSLIAIIISCLGLYGLTLFMIENSIKEIGIRKVLGASVITIVARLYGKFTTLVLLSNIIAVPVSMYAMNKWLQNYAYRIDMSWWIFVISGGIALLISITTVSYLTIKAAMANPVESLKYE